MDDGGLRIGFKRAVQELAPGAGPADEVVAEIQVGLGRIVVSEIEVPNLAVNIWYRVDEQR